MSSLMNHMFYGFSEPRFMIISFETYFYKTIMHEINELVNKFPVWTIQYGPKSRDHKLHKSSFLEIGPNRYNRKPPKPLRNGIGDVF